MAKILNSQLPHCGNCEWWDIANATQHLDCGIVVLAAHCLYPIPNSILWEIKSIMTIDEGNNCKAYKRHKDDKS